MLTSIRGLSAATLSAGLFLSAAPAFAMEDSSSAATDGIGSEAAISDELIAASAAIDGTGAEGTGIVLTTQIDRANEPLERAESNSVGGSSGLSFSANVALTSEYRFRGVDLSGGEIAIQGGFDISHSSGFYVGTWASSLDEDTVGYGSTELDIYGGWSGSLTDGLSADIGFIAYTYPDASGPNSTVEPGNFDYYEFYGSLGFSLGPVSSTVGVAYAPDQDGLDFGGPEHNTYVYTDVSVGISGTPLTVNGHLGYTDGSLTFTNDSEAFDWAFSVDVALGGNFSANIAYIEAEGDIAPGAYDFTDAAIVGTVSASF